MTKFLKRPISILLAVLMIAGIFTALPLTAYAAPTETLLTTITATGQEQANYSTANVATVSFSYSAEGSSAYFAKWGWWGYGWTATVNAAEGYTITKCVFYDDANRTATDSSSPFVVETTEEDKTPQVNGTPILADTSKGIKKIEVYGYATPAHIHSFTYSASGATITATCNGAGTCDITSGTTLTISAPTGDLTADGSKTFPATLSTGYNTTAFPGTYTIAYTKDGQPFDGTPTEAGDYTASVTVGTATASVSYTVTAPTYTVTWKNWNGDVLETDENVVEGATPTYDGETPTKAANDDYTYTFTGWTPEVVAANADATYTATFDETPKYETGYYLVGTMTETAWTIDPAYKLTQNPANEAEYMLAETAFTAGTEFKVVYVAPGTRTWYPDNVPNYVISEDGNYSIYFRPDGQGGNDWYCGTIYASAAATEPITVLVGHSISLYGDIGVNYYTELSDTIATSKTAKMRFTIPTGSGTTTQDVLVKDATPVTSGDKTYYVFKCQVAAKEMTSQITAQLIDGDYSSAVFPYSVKDYADYLLAHTGDNADYANAARLVKAMLNYGAYAQLYFDKNTGNLANADLTNVEKALGDVEITIDDPVIDLPYGVTFEGATLSLKSETTLSLYFTSSADLTFSCGNYTVETATKGGYQIARIRGIKAADIGKILTLNFSGGTVSGGSVSYSPLNYCKYVLADNMQDENLQNAVKALYLYWQAAATYFSV